MIQRITKYIFLFFLLCGVAFPLYAQDIGYVTYLDSTQNVNTSRQLMRTRFRAKAQYNQSTLLSRLGKMKAVYDADDVYMLDGMLHCLRMSMDIWEEMIEFDRQVSFIVRFRDDMDPDLEIKTVVAYSTAPQKTSSIPYSLYNQTGTSAQIRDTIYVNANVDWHYTRSYDLSDEGSDNLTTAFLRHIAHILGFGTSVTMLNGQLNYAVKSTPSLFDALVADQNGNKLSALGRRANTQTLTAFLGRTLHLALSSASYPLFGSSGYVPYRSANYFSLPNDNLMNYPFVDRAASYCVNRETLDALEAIGWTKTRTHDMMVSGTLLDPTGYGSYYDAHCYELTDSAGARQQGISWKYEVLDNSTGVWTTVRSATGETFNVPVSGSEDGDADDYGCLEARISAGQTVSGLNKTYCKPIFLDMMPVLDGFSIANVNKPANSNYFSFDVIITHRGTESGELAVCNEYGLSTSYEILGDGETTVHVTSAFKYGMTYFDLTLSNAYGDNVKMLYYDDYAPTGMSLIADGANQLWDVRATINGLEVADTLVVHEQDDIRLEIVDSSGGRIQSLPEGMSINWKLLLESENGKWQKTVGGNASECRFMICEGFLPKIEAWFAHDEFHPFNTYVDSTTFVAYHKGILQMEAIDTSGHMIRIVKPIRIEVLPTMPRLTITNYREVSYEGTDDMEPVVELELVACNFTGGLFQTSTASWLGSTGDAFGADVRMPYRLTIDWGSMGCGYSCEVDNAFGGIECPFVFPSPSVMSVRNAETSPCVKSEVHEGGIHIECSECSSYMAVYDAHGHLVEFMADAASMYTRSLPSGIYCVVVGYNGKKITIKQIVK